MARQAEEPEPRLAFGLAGLGVLLLAWGSTWGLAYAPRETYMGDVQRIMYVHVPTAWNAMLALSFAFACALFYLIRGGWQWDSRLEAAMEVGVVLSALDAGPSLRSGPSICDDDVQRLARESLACDVQSQMAPVVSRSPSDAAAASQPLPRAWFLPARCTAVLI